MWRTSPVGLPLGDAGGGGLGWGEDGVYERAEGADIRGQLLNLAGGDALGDAGPKDPEPLVLLLDAELRLGELAGYLEAGLAQGQECAAARSQGQHHRDQLCEHVRP